MGSTRSWLDERGLGDLPGIQQFLFTPTNAEAATPRRQITRTVGTAPPTPQELLRRAEIQRLGTDHIIKRARVARELRQERKEHQQDRADPDNLD
jgi:hypothetical protein